MTPHAYASSLARSSAHRPRVNTTPQWHRWWPVMGALLYAYMLAALPNDLIKDRDNYLAYLDNSPIFLLGWVGGDTLSILANEPLWILINATLSALLSNEMALKVLIFVPAAVVAHLVLRVEARHALLLAAFLLMPQVLKNHVVHLRQGVAVSVFLLGWFATTRGMRWPLILITPLLHSSFFFVLMLLGIAWVLKRPRLPTSLTMVLTIGTYAVLGVTVGLVLGVLVRAVGARQGEEVQFVAAEGISGLGFVYWSIALGLLLTQSRRFLREHVLEIGAVAFYLATYFLSPFTARVFESTLLLILLGSLKMKDPGRLAFIGSVLLFAALQWLMMYIGSGSIFTEP